MSLHQVGRAFASGHAQDALVHILVEDAQLGPCTFQLGRNL